MPTGTRGQAAKGERRSEVLGSNALDKAAATDKVKGQIAAIEAERDTLKKRVDSLPAEIEAAATQRADLLAQVAPHMSKAWKGDGKGEVAIKREALGVLEKDLKLDGKSDDFVRGAGRLRAGRPRAPTRARAAPRVQPVIGRVIEDGSSDDDEPKPSAAEQRMKDRNKDAWKVPVRGAMTRDGIRR